MGTMLNILYAFFIVMSVLDLLVTYFHSNGHNQKVHMHMVDLMSSIICEGDTVSQELLDTVLVNLVPAHKVGAQHVDAGSHSKQHTFLHTHIVPHGYW